MKDCNFTSRQMVSIKRISILLACFSIGLCATSKGQTLGELTTTMGAQETLERGMRNQPGVGQPAEVNEQLQPEKKSETQNVPAESEPNEQPALRQIPEANEAVEINDFNSFQRELSRINLESRSEETQWLGRIERKVELAKAIDDLVVAQLRFLRKIAETEQAEQTIKAIDLVLKQRQERLENLTEKLQEELIEGRQQQSERRTRATRSTNQEQSQSERRPIRRQREASNEQ